MLRAAGWIVVGVLLACAAFELALALGAGTVGPEPGSGVRGESTVSTIALLAMLAAILLGVAFAFRPAALPAAFLAPAAASFLVFFWRTYDPYYAPDLRRYSDGGAAGGWWIFLILAASVGAGFLTRRRPRQGAVVTSIVVAVVLLTTLFAGDGH